MLAEYSLSNERVAHFNTHNVILWCHGRLLRPKVYTAASCECVDKFPLCLRYAALQPDSLWVVCQRTSSRLCGCCRLPSMAGENAYNEKDYDAKMQEL